MLPESIRSIVIDNKGPLNTEELIMDESIKVLEYAIYTELNECLLKVENGDNRKDLSLVRTVAELQCALDIVQSAKTQEETRRVYEILMCLGGPG